MDTEVLTHKARVLREAAKTNKRRLVQNQKQHSVAEVIAGTACVV